MFYFRYVTFNFGLALVLLALFFRELDLTISALIIATLVILIQYKFLNFKTNWFYKSLIFYLGLLIFLFFFGIVFGWNEAVGGHTPGSWAARLDAGLRLMIYGQFFGGLLAYPIIVVLNYLFRKFLFRH